MAWIDQAAYACSTAWSQRYCVTAFVGGIRFARPIIIGDVVEVEAQLTYTGNSSMNIAVEVKAGDLKGGELETTSECAVVMVCVDSHGKPIQVEPFEPDTEEEISRASNVKKRLMNR